MDKDESRARMSALETLFEDWTLITSPKKLRDLLLAAVKILRDEGQSDLATKWEESIRRMPSGETRKEAINYVLQAVYWELQAKNLLPENQTLEEEGLRDG